MTGGDGREPRVAAVCGPGHFRAGRSACVPAYHDVIGPVAGMVTVTDAPADAPVVVYASYSAVQVRDIVSPIRVTATHARATILNTTGRVDASAFVVDFAGSRGTVNLSADEINLKMTAPRFDGELLAWAQQPVRVFVPPGFIMPFQALVNRPQDFVCRADFFSKMTQKKKGGLYVFTYTGDGNTAPEAFHLRSEHSTVVVDSSTETRPRE